MKNLSLVVAFLLFMTGCSSGTTVANTPVNITGIFTGEYESSNERDSGTMTLNIVEDESGNLSGTFQISFDQKDPSCLLNGTVASGTSNGFNVSIIVSQGGAGEITFQLTNSAGNTLTGTYVSNSACSNASGSGTVVFSR